VIGLDAAVLHAYLVGTMVAAACGVVGTLLVLRGEVFSADALGHVAFTGAMAALVLGLSLGIGLYGACALFAVGLALLGRRGTPDDVRTGSAFAWVLGIGALLLAQYASSSSAPSGTAGVAVLFGSLFSLTPAAAWRTTLCCAVALVLLVVLLRPLLFLSLDPEVAAGRGLPIRSLSVGFALVTAVVAAATTEAVGALLLLGLLAAPAGAALKVVTSPYRAVLVSTALAVGSVWAGLTWSLLEPAIPPSTAIVAVAALGYAAAALLAQRRRQGRLLGSAS